MAQVSFLVCLHKFRLYYLFNPCRATRSRDKDCIMTCVYGSILNGQPADSSTSVIVYSDEGKILSYDKKLFKSQKTKVPLVSTSRIALNEHLLIKANH